MKNILIKLFFFLIITVTVTAQEASSFFATMDSKDALKVKMSSPNEIDILATENDQSAVYISRKAAIAMHNRLLHGPGYVFKTSKEQAMNSLTENFINQNNNKISFSITEDELVSEALELVNAQNIEEDILILEGYGTRYHTTSSANQAVLDLKDKWEAMALAAGRTDVSVRIFNHTNTSMPSVIMTIEGAVSPEDYIIVGGHIDSTNPSNNNDSPGADDNASGIATIIEMSRVLFEMEFVPKKTVEFMAFSAEEIGLVGSGEIAQEYHTNGINVEAFVQFDMTNYAGSTNDIYITTDSYNSSTLNNFLIDLIGHYNSSGNHQFNYGTTSCNYGCSDHYSFAQQGYNAAFPFEASFGQHNPNIHSSQDTYSFMGTTNHAAKFAKLGVEFIIESAKANALSIADYQSNRVIMVVKDKNLSYRIIDLDDTIKDVSIYDVSGKKIMTDLSNDSAGLIPLQNLAQGFYIAVFNFNNSGYKTKKFILN